MPRLDPDQFEAYDHPEELARVATEISGTPEPTLEVRLQVPAIHCAACTTLIEQALGPSTQSVRAFATTQQVQIRWNPSKTRLSALLQRLKEIGYPAIPQSREAASVTRTHEQRQALWRLFVAFFCMMQVMMYALPRYVASIGELMPDQLQLLRWAEWMLTVPVVFFSAAPMFSAAWSSLALRRVTMDVPVALGISIAFAASTIATFTGEGEVWNDSVTMFITFLLAGRWLEARLRARTAAGLDRLLTRIPEMVDRIRSGFTEFTESNLERVPAGRLQPGDRIRIVAGQTFPADAVVVAGQSHADEALLTGESNPIPKRTGDSVIAGSLNLDGLVWLIVERTGRSTRFGQIADLVQKAADEKPPAALMADRWAQGFLVAVLIAAALSGLIWSWIEPERALSVVVSVLIVTCPCAISLAMPAVMLAATSRLAESGILLRSPAVLEALAKIDLFAFDKTGTLSTGKLAIEAIQMAEATSRFTEQECLAIATAVAQGSLHPIAQAISSASASASAKTGELPVATQVSEIAGSGVAAEVSFRGERLQVHLGRQSFVRGTAAPNDGPSQEFAEFTKGANSPGTFLAIDHQLVARFAFREDLRADARETLAALAAAGIRIAVLSGDQAPAVARLTEGLDIDETLADATPESKYAWVADMQAKQHLVAVVGDGVNDAPMLALANVSIAVGSAAPIAQLGSDVILLSDRLGDLIVLRRIATRAVRIIRQNLFWAAAYNAVCVPLALAGAMPPAAAGLGMAGSSLFVILNALRLVR
jgi:Cu2+-exporting ATPase